MRYSILNNEDISELDTEDHYDEVEETLSAD